MDQSLLAAPHGLSQRATSFIASYCQGIHQMPFKTLDPSHAGASPTRDALFNSAQHPHVPDHGKFDPDTLKEKPIHDVKEPSTNGGRDEAGKDPATPNSWLLLNELTSVCPSGAGRSHPASLAPPLHFGALNARVWRNGHHGNGGGERDRTDDLLLAKQALSQLSYAPIFTWALRRRAPAPQAWLSSLALRGAQCACRFAPGPPASTRAADRTMVGPARFELATPRLSSVCSNQLSYEPGCRLIRSRKGCGDGALGE